MRAPVGTSLIFNSLLGAVAAFGHVVYPLVLALRTRRLVDPIPPTPLRWPAITGVIPAYRERSVIGWKIENLRDNGYAGRLEIVVVAEDEPTAAAARAAGVRVLASGERLGKSAALNLGVAAASGSIVVITDANNRLAPGALAALTRWFSDPDVGAVAGEKRVDDEAEGVYWRFESWLKRHESRTGHTIGLVGELAAFRREAYRPIPAGVMIDDLWIGLDIIAATRRCGSTGSAERETSPVSTR
ncbi:MAG: glycosyltransferase [Gaiellales bacterium]